MMVMPGAKGEGWGRSVVLGVWHVTHDSSHVGGGVRGHDHGIAAHPCVGTRVSCPSSILAMAPTWTPSPCHVLTHAPAGGRWHRRGCPKLQW